MADTGASQKPRPLPSRCFAWQEGHTAGEHTGGHYNSFYEGQRQAREDVVREPPDSWGVWTWRVGKGGVGSQGLQRGAPAPEAGLRL